MNRRESVCRQMDRIWTDIIVYYTNDEEPDRYRYKYL